MIKRGKGGLVTRKIWQMRILIHFLRINVNCIPDLPLNKEALAPTPQPGDTPLLPLIDGKSGQHKTSKLPLEQ